MANIPRNIPSEQSTPLPRNKGKMEDGSGSMASRLAKPAFWFLVASVLFYMLSHGQNAYQTGGLGITMLNKPTSIERYQDTYVFDNILQKHFLKDHQAPLKLIHYWATWCSPCIKELPTLLALQKKLEAEHPGKIQIWVISIDNVSDFAPIQSFLNEHQLADLTTYFDPSGQNYYRMNQGFNSLPYTALVNGSGEILGFVPGKIDWMQDEVIEFLLKQISLEKLAD